MSNIVLYVSHSSYHNLRCSMFHNTKIHISVSEQLPTSPPPSSCSCSCYLSSLPSPCANMSPRPAVALCSVLLGCPALQAALQCCTAAMSSTGSNPAVLECPVLEAALHCSSAAVLWCPVLESVLQCCSAVMSSTSVSPAVLPNHWLACQLVWWLLNSD